MNRNIDAFLRIVWQTALLVGLVLGALLCHDGFTGNRGQWLPYAFDSYRELGLLLVPVCLAAIVSEVLRGFRGTPMGQRLTVIFRWTVRIIGLLLLALPWVTLLGTVLTQPAGRRLGGEGVGLGLSLLFALCTPPGLGLMVFSFFIRDKATKPEPQNPENPDV